MEIATYYEQTNQVVTPSMMTWPTLNSLSIHMTALSNSDTHADIFHIKSNMPMTKYLEYFKFHLASIIGL